MTSERGSSPDSDAISPSGIEDDVVYVAIDPDGVWARSEFPDELVTVDYDGQGRVIGVEVISSLAQHSAARSGERRGVGDASGGWQSITPEHYALYEQAGERARALLDDEREEVAAVAADSYQMADEALALWGSIDTQISLAEKKRNDAALLRLGIDDAIQALTHLMKQSGKADQSEIVSRVVQRVVLRLHQVLAGENPYGS